MTQIALIDTKQNKKYDLSVAKGMRGWLDGKSLSDNPYPEDSLLYTAWLRGYESEAESDC